jgi:hypothetical protein
MNVSSSLNDTFYIIQQFGINAEENESYFKLSFNDILTFVFTIIGIIIAIYQFKKQMTKNREEQKLANIKNWYLTVIVIPQLESINSFYSKLIDNLIENVDELNRIGEKDLAVLSQMQADRKDDINAFFDHLQSLIKSFDIELSKKLSHKIMDLEDCVTIILSDIYFDINSLSSTQIRRELLLNKKDIISLLYTGIDDK